MELLDLEYLGTPYSDNNGYLQDFRAKIVDIIATELTNQGRAIYSPISSWHHIACKYTMPKTFEFWERMNLSFLKQCKRLLVVTLPGWETSVGLKGEIEFAEYNEIEVEHIDPQPYFEKLLIMDLEKARQLFKKLEI
jgi:hypothetical protein